MTKHQNSLPIVTKAPFAILLAMGLFLGACGDPSAESPSEDEDISGTTAEENNQVDVGAGGSSGAALGDMALGPVDAPVTVIEYASLTCHHCASFHMNTFPRLKQNFIDTGRIRFVMREYPLDRYALEAAILSRCGGEDKYFDIVDALFEGQEEWAFRQAPDAIRDGLRDYAEKFDISDEQYDACLADKALEARLSARISEGANRYNVSATPTIVINGEKYEGSPAYTEVAKFLLTILPAQ
ncbi:MAG: DsbA family protein [Proteobacteria bacterium]|nr:DsbA family protein [Pseudomonadota bacterium]